MNQEGATRIAIIGFGEAGQAFAASLSAARPVHITAYDILQDTEGDAALRAAAAELSVDLAETALAAVTGAIMVISAVTAVQSLRAAQSVANALQPGQIFIDINSVSPGRKQETAALIEETGAVYSDMAVMAPVHPRGHKTPVLIAGPDEAVLASFLQGFGFDFDRVGDAPGAATTIKMIRSLFVKGLEALTVQALTAAAQQGVYERIFASLSGSYPGLDWARFPAYQFERMATHGLRRAAEMRESAATFDEFGMKQGRNLAAAIAALHDVVGAAKLILQAVPPETSAGRVAAVLRRDKP